LSKRTKTFHPGECRSVTDIADPECPHCGCNSI
jgi:hypothetical protein